jgi:hypothetical protein
MTEYTLIYSDTVPRFTDKVEQKLAEGWELYGNPFMDSENWPHQAMTRTRPDIADVDPVIPVGEGNQ